MKVSVIGLGKLGSPMAACFAAHGHEVVGVDLSQQTVDLINGGKAPVFEPGLEEMLDRTEGRLAATTDLHQAVLDTDVSFIIVPTPSQPDGGFSTKFVLEAAETIGQAIGEKSSDHLVVLTSTVMPGATAEELKPALERASGKVCSRDFGLCYSPEFISLGSVIQDYLHPDFLLIGESDQAAGDRLSEVYRPVCQNDPPIQRMALANAELTKLALNTFVTTKISYANMLAEICEHLPSGDVDAVTSAIGLDSRVGRKYLKGAVGYGGPCFPRDNQAIIALAGQLGVTAPLPIATDEINSHQVPRLRELVYENLPPDGVVGILGLAYKPDTNFVEQSQGLLLAQALASDGVSVIAHDPHADDQALGSLQEAVAIAQTPSDVARKADVIVITIPCAEFRDIAVEDVCRSNGQVSIIDCWRILPQTQFADACNLLHLGTHNVRREVKSRKAA